VDIIVMVVVCVYVKIKVVVCVVWSVCLSLVVVSI